jgi:hypothetical protein
VIEVLTGDLLTRATIWLAMLSWTGGIVSGAGGRARFSRGLWTVGLLIYAFHICFAYSEFHQWSHFVAWESTARDTLEMTGMDSGVGLLVNYAFALVLAIDVFRQWQKGRRKGAGWIDGLVIFMIVNGAIIFGSGPVRWFGAGLIAVILWVLVCRRLSVRV